MLVICLFHLILAILQNPTAKELSDDKASVQNKLADDPETGAEAKKKRRKKNLLSKKKQTKKTSEWSIEEEE